MLASRLCLLKMAPPSIHSANGAGMPHDAIRRNLDRSTRVAARRNRRTGPSGSDLAGIDNIADLHCCSMPCLALRGLRSTMCVCIYIAG